MRLPRWSRWLLVLAAVVAGIFLAAAVATALLQLLASDNAGESFFAWDVEDIEVFMGKWGAWSVIGSIVLMVLHSFVPLPAELIAIANGMMFGPIWGVVVTWVGAMIGAGCAFAMARYLGKPLGRRFISGRRWHEFASWQARPSTLLLVRLTPIVSFNMVNFAAGLTGVGWRPFLWTTGIGILPITIVSVVLGNQLLSLSWPVWLAAGAGILSLWCILHWLAKRRDAAK